MKKHLAVTLKAVLFLALWLVSVALSARSPLSAPAFLNASAAWLRLWRELLPLIGVLLSTGAFVFAVEKGKVYVPLYTSPLKDALWGFSIGIAWLCAAIVPLYLLNVLTLGDMNEVSHIAVWFIAVLLNAAMQEYLMRGYLFSLLAKSYNVIVATIITTLIFTALHGGAFEAGVIAVLNVITMSVFVSILLVYTKSLLAPIIVHFVWNAVGHLIFGIVSLADDYPSLWNGVLSGDALVTGGSAKLEGSIVVLIVNILLIALMIYMIKKCDRSAVN